jgi:hypothetical protein
MVRVHWSGAGALAVRIQVAAKRGVKAEVVRAMREEMKIELREVVKRTPKDTNALRESERIEGPQMVGNSVAFNIVAGNEKVDYALFVHEDLETVRNVGGPKFIESVVNESAPYFPRRIARRLQLKKLI